MATIHPNSLKNLTYKFPKGSVPWNKASVRKECEVCLSRFEVPQYRRESARFCSRRCLGIKRMTGENNPNWIGGGWLLVRKQVLKEQDYTCQDCGLREPEIMEVNHKEEKSRNPELAREKGNLEVLCPNCHQRKTNEERRNKIFKK